MIIRYDRLAKSTIFSILTLSLTCGATEPVKDEMAILKGGIPETLPGFKVSREGELVVADPVKQSVSNCVERKLKAKIVWQAFPTARAENMLADQRLDFIYPVQFTDERKTNFLPTSYAWKTKIYVLKAAKVDLTDRNIRIGVRLNSPEHVDATKNGYTKISTPYDFDGLARMLSSHMIDVAVVPETAYSELKEKWPQDVVIEIDKIRETGYLLNRNDPKNLRINLNVAIQDCRTETPTK